MSIFSFSPRNQLTPAARLFNTELGAVHRTARGRLGQSPLPSFARQSEWRTAAFQSRYSYCRAAIFAVNLLDGSQEWPPYNWSCVRPQSGWRSIGSFNARSRSPFLL